MRTQSDDYDTERIYWLINGLSTLAWRNFGLVKRVLLNGRLHIVQPGSEIRLQPRSSN